MIEVNYRLVGDDYISLPSNIQHTLKLLSVYPMFHLNSGELLFLEDSVVTVVMSKEDKANMMVSVTDDKENAWGLVVEVGKSESKHVIDISLIKDDLEVIADVNITPNVILHKFITGKSPLVSMRRMKEMNAVVIDDFGEKDIEEIKKLVSENKCPRNCYIYDVESDIVVGTLKDIVNIRKGFPELSKQVEDLLGIKVTNKRSWFSKLKFW